MTRKLKTSSQAVKEPVSVAVHFRLCHLCLFLNEASDDIAECEACQCAFISELAWDTGAQARRHLEAELEDDDLEEGFRRDGKRLNGLSVVW